MALVCAGALVSVPSVAAADQVTDVLPLPSPSPSDLLPAGTGSTLDQVTHKVKDTVDQLGDALSRSTGEDPSDETSGSTSPPSGSGSSGASDPARGGSTATDPAHTGGDARSASHMLRTLGIRIHPTDRPCCSGNPRLSALVRRFEALIARQSVLGNRIDKLQAELRSLRAQRSRTDGAGERAIGDVGLAAARLVLALQDGMLLADPTRGRDVSASATVAASRIAAIVRRRDRVVALRARLDRMIASHRREMRRLTTAIAALRKQETATRRIRQETLSIALAPVRGYRPDPATAPTRRAAIAVRTALRQVGDPYVWGAAGPDSFDCSGLTMYAWAHAGLLLPHNAAAQAAVIRHVPFSRIEPGDLLFYEHPIGHVTMYIGNGEMVEAPYTGAYVRVVPVRTYDLVAAGRP